MVPSDEKSVYTDLCTQYIELTHVVFSQQPGRQDGRKQNRETFCITDT